MTYQVGDLVDFTDDDPIFGTLEDAYHRAEEQSLKFYECYFGVWDEEGELIAIYHQGRSYTP